MKAILVITENISICCKKSERKRAENWIKRSGYKLKYTRAFKDGSLIVRGVKSYFGFRKIQ